eukprot:c46382_g1_i1.p1 GENE.c46382_g1_i1~~c46382_g1_i1.p1  ORF type:complete len:551 (+),score=84.12 c46382_g1_i1:37-1689(+)
MQLLVVVVVGLAFAGATPLSRNKHHAPLSRARLPLMSLEPDSDLSESEPEPPLERRQRGPMSFTKAMLWTYAGRPGKEENQRTIFDVFVRPDTYTFVGFRGFGRAEVPRLALMDPQRTMCGVYRPAVVVDSETRGAQIGEGLYFADEARSIVTYAHGFAARMFVNCKRRVEGQQENGGSHSKVAPNRFYRSFLSPPNHPSSLDLYEDPLERGMAKRGIMQTVFGPDLINILEDETKPVCTVIYQAFPVFPPRQLKKSESGGTMATYDRTLKHPFASSPPDDYNPLSEQSWLCNGFRTMHGSDIEASAGTDPLFDEESDGEDIAAWPRRVGPLPFARAQQYTQDGETAGNPNTKVQVFIAKANEDVEPWTFVGFRAFAGDEVEELQLEEGRHCGLYQPERVSFQDDRWSDLGDGLYLVDDPRAALPRATSGYAARMFASCREEVLGVQLNAEIGKIKVHKDRFVRAVLPEAEAMQTVFGVQVVNGVPKSKSRVELAPLCHFLYQAFEVPSEALSDASKAQKVLRHNFGQVPEIGHDPHSDTRAGLCRGGFN